MKLADENLHVCLWTSDFQSYLIVIYPPMENLHLCLLEQQTTHLVRLIDFLFGSIQHGLRHASASMDSFFEIFFYRWLQLIRPTSAIFKRTRPIDEFLPAQFNEYGTCPKLPLDEAASLLHVDTLLNRLDCQQLDDAAVEDDLLDNRYGRVFLIVGSVLFHCCHLVSSHLSNELTTDIYRFLLHYGHLNISEFAVDHYRFLLFKEIYPSDSIRLINQRFFLLVACQGHLTLAVMVQSEYQNRDTQ
jgi:hypothetical protein